MTLLETFGSTFNEREKYTYYVIDKEKGFYSMLVSTEYIPSEFDLKYYSPVEIAKKQIERRKTIIKEVQYEYYQ